MKKLITAFLFIGIFSALAVADPLNIHGFFLGMTPEQFSDAAEKLGCHAYQHEQKIYSINNSARIMFFNGKYIKIFDFNDKNFYVTAKERAVIESFKIGERIESVLKKLTDINLKTKLEIFIKKSVVAKEQIFSEYGIKYVESILQAVFINNKLDMIQFDRNLVKLLIDKKCEKEACIQAVINFYGIPQLQKTQHNLWRYTSTKDFYTIELCSGADGGGIEVIRITALEKPSEAFSF